MSCLHNSTAGITRVKDRSCIQEPSLASMTCTRCYTTLQTVKVGLSDRTSEDNEQSGECNHTSWRMQSYKLEGELMHCSRTLLHLMDPMLKKQVGLRVKQVRTE